MTRIDDPKSKNSFFEVEDDACVIPAGISTWLEEKKITNTKSVLFAILRSEKEIGNRMSCSVLLHIRQFVRKCM